MKRKIQILAAILVCSLFTNLQSQIVLNANKFLPVGSSWIQKPIQSFNVIDTSIKGANVIWNFAALQATSAVATTISIVNPAQTPYASSFPNATYCYKESPSIAYRYYSLTPTVFERIGSFSSTGLKTYSDPQIELTFPFQLGTVSNDTWMNSASSSGGTYDFECVGSGKLILPTAIYNNVLLALVKVHESFLNLTCYYWYSADNGAFLMYYIIGDGFFVPNQGAFIQSLNIGVDETIALKNFSYNNPVTDLLKINYNSNIDKDVEYTLINSLGEKVYSQTSKISLDENINIDINMSSFKSGLYFLTIKSNKTGKILKTTKVIKI